MKNFACNGWKYSSLTCSYQDLLPHQFECPATQMIREHMMSPDSTELVRICKFVENLGEIKAFLIVCGKTSMVIVFGHCPTKDKRSKISMCPQCRLSRFECITVEMLDGIG